MAILIVLILLILFLHLLLLLLFHLLPLATSVRLLLEGIRSVTDKQGTIREQADTQRTNTEPTLSAFRCNSGREFGNNFYFKMQDDCSGRKILNFIIFISEIFTRTRMKYFRYVFTSQLRNSVDYKPGNYKLFLYGMDFKQNISLSQ